MGLWDNGRKELEVATLSSSFAVKGNSEMGCRCGSKWVQENIYFLDGRITACRRADNRG